MLLLFKKVAATLLATFVLVVPAIPPNSTPEPLQEASLSLQAINPANSEFEAIKSKSGIDEAIDKLAQCESQQTPDLRIIDTNGKYSTGWLMFQDATFEYFGEKYDLPHDDIWNPEQQIAIAQKMIENGYWYHWRICGKKIGLDNYSA